MMTTSNNMPRPPCRPPKFNHSVESLLVATKDLIQRRATLVDQLTQNRDGNFTFANTILPFFENENMNIRERRILNFYSSNSTSADLRSASRTAAALLTDADLELYQRSDFYTAVKCVIEKGENIDSEYSIYLEILMQTFLEHGMMLSEPAKMKEFASLRKELSKAQRSILKNIQDSKAGVWFTPKELHGVPQSFITNHTKADRENEDNIWVSFKESDTSPIFRFAEIDSTRRKLYAAMQIQVPENIDLFVKVFSIRDTLARMLGFEHHADFRSRTQTLGSYKTVLKFLSQVNQAMQTLQKKDIEKMLQLKKSDLEKRNRESKDAEALETPADKIAVWEKPYYIRKVKEETCEFDERLVNEYYTFENTLNELFRLYGHIFNIRFVSETAQEDERLHEEVKLYSVWEVENGDFIGWLYIDAFPRDGKYNHFGHYSLQPGVDRDKNIYPVSAIIANFPRPTATSPSILSHRLCKRLFHELGHAMHGLLSETKTVELQGVSRNRDFSEAVSIMFENFLWIPAHMADCSLHYSYLSPEYLAAWQESNPGSSQPPKRLPADMINKLVKSKNVCIADDMLGRLHFSYFDLSVHMPTRHEEVCDAEFIGQQWVKWAKISQYWGYDEAEGSSGYSRYRLIASGYDAYYYCYVFSQVWAFDMFETGFKADTMNQQNGKRCRELVIKPGESKKSMDILKDFLGREPNADAFARGLGLEIGQM